VRGKVWSGVLAMLAAPAVAQAAPTIALSPKAATRAVSTTHTLTATVTDGGAPVAVAPVVFQWVSGPDVSFPRLCIGEHAVGLVATSRSVPSSAPARLLRGSIRVRKR
jgi:hypothetical protein